MPQLQRFVSRLAAAIHSADPTALVGVGQHSLPYCTDAKVRAGLGGRGCCRVLVCACAHGGEGGGVPWPAIG